MTEGAQRKLAAILAADVVGYSRLMSEDETGTLAALRHFRREVLAPTVAEYGGKLIKSMGDGWLVEFASVAYGVSCAVKLQESLADNERIKLRVGLHIGDVTFEDEDIYGDGVNVASRLQEIAEPGGVVISGAARSGIDKKLAAGFQDLGAHELKNIAEPISAFGWGMKARRNRQAALSLPDKPSVAVLPFENMSGDPEQEYFSDGVTEDIITELTKIAGLFVIARHSAFAYKGQVISLREIGRELGVRYVLEGSLRRAGRRLRITAQLIDAKSDRHLWAERYDRNIDDIFAVQDEVARAVAAALTVTLQPEEGQRLARAPTDNIDAYDIYLRSRSTPWPPTRENILSARSAYQRIHDMEPSFAGGLAGLSLTYSLAVMFGHSEASHDDAATALELARRAVRLDDQFAQAHCAFGLAYSIGGRHEDAIVCAEQALALQPGDADAHLFAALCFLFAGDCARAYDHIQTALRLDPQFIHGPYLNVLGFVCVCAGHYEEALDALQRNVDRGGPLGVPALVFRIVAHAMLGEVGPAHEAVKHLSIFFPGFSISRFSLPSFLRDQKVAERFADGLRKAGAPE